MPGGRHRAPGAAPAAPRRRGRTRRARQQSPRGRDARPHPYGEAEARAFIESAKRRPAGGCVYAITNSDSGAFIGCIGLNGKARGLELGYWIGEPYWGRGYATEAAHAAVDLAFRATAVDALNVSCRVTNAASRRVIHKCGFQYAGQGMLDSLVAGQVPVERYRLDRRTWVSLRSWGQI